MSEELNAADEAEIRLLEALEEEPYEIPAGEDVYDHAKAQAYMCEAIDLAQERGLNLLELREACSWVAQACNAQVASALQGLESVEPAAGVAAVPDELVDDAAQLADADGDEHGQGDGEAEGASDGLNGNEQTHS